MGSVTCRKTCRVEMNSDDPYLDVLQNLESIVVATYRENAEMTDYAPMRVYEALIEKYSAEKLNRPAKSHDLSLLEKVLYQRVYGMCEWRMGRDGELKEQLGTENISAIDLEVMIICLKKLLKSLNKWTKRNGRRGYIDFISQFC